MTLYGTNPDLYLAQTSYARMTGLTTEIDSSQIANADSYLQPMFVDMNDYYDSGLPAYPSFIGGESVLNPEIPIASTSSSYYSTSYPTTSYTTTSYPTTSSYSTTYPTTSYTTSYPTTSSYQQQAYPQYYQQQTVIYGQTPQYTSNVDVQGNVQSLVGTLVNGLDSIIIG